MERVPEDKLTPGERQARYNEHYLRLHGHLPGEPHTEECVPDPRHPDRR